MASFDPNEGLIFMALSQESQGLFESQGIKVHYTGVGKVKAAYWAQKLISDLKPKWILNLGTAGSHTISQGSLVECTSFVQRDPIFELFPQEKIETVPFTSLTKVTCGSADSIDYRPPRVFCDIYDMEAYALSYVCKEMKVRFNSVKFITDSSDQNTVQDWKKNLKLSSEKLLKFYQESLKS